MLPNVTTRNRLPRIGKIRLGEKRTSQRGAEYPAALPHFSFVDVPHLVDEFPKDPTEIFPVVFPLEAEEDFFPTARKAYRRSGLFCACSDGETATRVFVDKDEQGARYIEENKLRVKDGEMFEMPCPGEDCPYFANNHCKNIGRLLFMLPNVPRLGVYEITTTSYNSIVNVLSMTRMVAAQCGRVAGIPFALCLRPMEVQPEGKKKTVYVLELEFRGTVDDLKKAAGNLLGPAPEPAVEKGPDETPDDLYARGGEELDDKLDGKAPPEPATGADRLANRMDPGKVQDAKPAGPKAAPDPVDFDCDECGDQGKPGEPCDNCGRVLGQEEGGGSAPLFS